MQAHAGFGRLFGYLQAARPGLGFLIRAWLVAASAHFGNGDLAGLACRQLKKPGGRPGRLGILGKSILDSKVQWSRTYPAQNSQNAASVKALLSP